MRQPRSIIFYAWALLAAQLALVAGVIAFVLIGGARQRAALVDLHAKAQAARTDRAGGGLPDLAGTPALITPRQAASGGGRATLLAPGAPSPPVALA